MIGVICPASQRPIVEEFFELFKTPWEFHRPETTYDVVIATAPTQVAPSARLLIVSGSARHWCDVGGVSPIGAEPNGILISHRTHTFPVYRKAAVLEGSAAPLATIPDRSAVVGVEFQHTDQRIVRIGYDLFDEVGFLLSNGQPPARAAIPTLELHIDVLRDWMRSSGLAFVEVPPVPSGFDFAACLTHDVDFINLRDHITDRSILGFIARALFPANLRDTRSKIAWRRLWKNWRALLSLPAVYFRLCRDTWFDIDRFAEIERGLGATYFFIPLGNYPGMPSPNPAPRLRAARYDVTEHATLVQTLKAGGAEIGTHGLDAWYSPERGKTELNIIGSVAGQAPIGVRMHWLYFSADSPRHLEEAGFEYDSTMGFNEAVGFRSGTTQVFRFPGLARLLELPLNIMDSALFYGSRMGLSERDALASCTSVVERLKTYGGALTINWHTRSLSPERNWDEFYLELIQILRRHRTWFANSQEVVGWFRDRRRIRFDRVTSTAGRVSVRVDMSGVASGSIPGFSLRVHRPQAVPSISQAAAFTDVPLDGRQEIAVAVA
jgi:hypothetical protein